jgi:hypothetical protein
MIYIPKFIQTGSAIQKLIRGDTLTDTWTVYFYFLKISKVG